MAYYGPIQFSLIRACWQTIFFPTVICLLLGGAYYAFYDAGSIMEGMRQSVDKLRDLYQAYPYIALGLHGLLFLKGLLYRPKIGNLPIQLLMIGLGLSGVWFLATKIGLHPQEVLEKATSLHSSIPDVHLPDTPEDIPKPQKPIIVHPTKPNLLNQPPSEAPAFAEFKPANDGSWTASGYIGPESVVYVLNLESAITAASGDLVKYSKKPCIESTSTVEGQVIPGCSAWVEDSYIGSMPLPRMQVFFTPNLRPNRIILGSNVSSSINVSRTPADSFILTRKNNRQN